MTSDAQRLSTFIESQEERLFGEPFRERVFSDDEYATRLAALCAALGEADVHTMIVTAPDTMAWLHGYRSRWYRQHTSTSLPPAQCTVVDVASASMYMIEAGYHVELVRATSVLEDIRPMPGSDITHEPSLDDYVGFLCSEIAGAGRAGGRVGLELWSCLPSPAVSAQVTGALESAGHQIVDVTKLARGLRLRKSAAEIGMVEKAMAACDAGLLALREHVRAGMTELEAWVVYQTAVVAAGGEPAALHETVAAGTLMPTLHRLSSRQPLRRGQIFHADAASSYFGYHARGTRPYFIGSPPPELVELTAIAAGAREVLLSVGQVGAPWQDLMDALRSYYLSTGIEGGAAGYELGLTVAPADWVNEFIYGSDDTAMTGEIQSGTVFNFESWNMLALVDTVVFEESGTRLLSEVPLELMVIEQGS